jgi:hypothetical protein
LPRGLLVYVGSADYRRHAVCLSRPQDSSRATDAAFSALTSRCLSFKGQLPQVDRLPVPSPSLGASVVRWSFSLVASIASLALFVAAAGGLAAALAALAAQWASGADTRTFDLSPGLDLGLGGAAGEGAGEGGLSTARQVLLDAAADAPRAANTAVVHALVRAAAAAEF